MFGIAYIYTFIIFIQYILQIKIRTVIYDNTFIVK